jgi:hypothetical protein
MNDEPLAVVFIVIGLRSVQLLSVAFSSCQGLFSY